MIIYLFILSGGQSWERELVASDATTLGRKPGHRNSLIFLFNPFSNRNYKFRPLLYV